MENKNEKGKWEFFVSKIVQYSGQIIYYFSVIFSDEEVEVGVG